MDFAIIGGGVGGLTLALSLYNSGFRNIDIYESSPNISELGVGINVLPHAMREMEALGLLEKLLSVSVETSQLQYFTQHGQFVWKEDRGISAGYKWPQISIHRGQLIKVLYDAVVERLGSDRIHVGQPLKNFTQNSDGTVTAIFDNASKVVDCMIGCDGIHSVVRKCFYPDEGAPKWDGITMLRGVSLVNTYPSADSMIIAGKSQHRMVMYPISKHANSKGELLINWVAKHKTSSAQEMPKQEWIHEVDKSEIPEYFNNFSFLNVKELFDKASAIYKYPQVDRDPLPSWNFTNVTLLGDAAHPMYPSGSNGASQAILDAGVLSKNLAIQPSIEKAIEIYDHERRIATSEIVLMNRQAGPEKCIDVVEERAPNGFEKLSDIVSYSELKYISNTYKKTAGFDVNILNKLQSSTGVSKESLNI